MLRKSKLHFDGNVFPKRVIDLRASMECGGVRFCVPEQWDFHVVSHTWSQEVRALSQKVAGELMKGGWRRDADAAGLAYNEAFARASWLNEEPAYQPLRSFWCVLAADGVRKLWFDALCINQLDDEEKEDEIGSMGAYYRLSEGCYVVPHGIGTEFGFRALDPRGSSVPRWLTRAWTFQESLLPRRLSFIVERFDARTREAVAQEGQDDPSDSSWVDWDEESDQFTRRRIHLPSECAHPHEEEALYCLDARAYRKMMIALIVARDRRFRDLQNRGLRQEFNHAFGRLHQAANDEFSLEEVMKHIRRRECTNEEDRVLGILGLLGFPGRLQVRTRVTLDEQIMHLAHMLMKERPQLLISLCAADLEGYAGRPRISWLPNLRYSRYSRFEGDINMVHEYKVLWAHSAHPTVLNEDGSLVIKAPTIQASLSYSHIAPDGSNYLLDVAHCFTIQFSPAPPYHGLPWGFQWVNPNDAPFLPQHPHNLLPLQPDGRFTFFVYGGISIPAQNIHYLIQHPQPTSFPICNITLILLGLSGHDPRCIIMACIPGTNHELHKIGILICEDVHKDVFMHLFSRCDAMESLIGGFGDDLTAFLDVQLCNSTTKAHLIS